MSCFVSFPIFLLVEVFVRHTYGLSIRREISRKEDKSDASWGIWHGQRGLSSKEALLPDVTHSFRSVPYRKSFWGHAHSVWDPRVPWERCLCGLNIVSRLQWLVANLVASCCMTVKQPHFLWHPEWQEAEGPWKDQAGTFSSVVCHTAEPDVLSLFETENELQTDLWEKLCRTCLWNLRAFLSPLLYLLSAVNAVVCIHPGHHVELELKSVCSSTKTIAWEDKDDQDAKTNK